MKFIVAILLLGSFMLQISANILLWTHYKWNKTYISKVLCEKKDVPDSCCKGKCYLKKQVEKQEELPNTTNNTSKEQKSVKCQSTKDVFLDSMTYMFEQKERFFASSVPHLVHFPLKSYVKVLEKPPQVSFYS